MTAIADLLSPADRERLAGLAELRETQRLIAERGQQKPPPVPPTLDDLAERECSL